MTKIAATPYIEQIFKNLSQNRNFYNLETWHEASGTQVVIDNDSGLTLTYFIARSNLVTYMFELGKLLHRPLMGKNLQQRTKLTE